MQLGHVARADGRWRLYVFADRRGERLAGLCTWLTEDAGSPLRRVTPPHGDIDAVIDVRAILQVAHRDVVLSDLPPLLLPRKGTLGLIDYEKAFCADPRAGRDIFDMRRIDRELGCLVIARPDQFVAHLLPLDAHDEIAAFFAPILRCTTARHETAASGATVSGLKAK